MVLYEFFFFLPPFRFPDVISKSPGPIWTKFLGIIGRNKIQPSIVFDMDPHQDGRLAAIFVRENLLGFRTITRER